MTTLNVILNQAGQIEPETLSKIYALIPNPSFRQPHVISALLKNAVKTLRTWKAQVYECEFAGALLIFAHSEALLTNYKVQSR